MLHLLWDLRQEQNIAEARSTAGSASARATDVAEYAKHLEFKVERLALICRAMWSFLQESAGVTEETLAERMKELDRADGVEDGRVKKASVKCEKCGKMISAQHLRCIWCGTERPSQSAFDTV